VPTPSHGGGPECRQAFKIDAPVAKCSNSQRSLTSSCSPRTFSEGPKPTNRQYYLPPFLSNMCFPQETGQFTNQNIPPPSTLTRALNAIPQYPIIRYLITHLRRKDVYNLGLSHPAIYHTLNLQSCASRKSILARCIRTCSGPPCWGVPETLHFPNTKQHNALEEDPNVDMDVQMCAREGCWRDSCKVGSTSYPQKSAETNIAQVLPPISASRERDPPPLDMPHLLSTLHNAPMYVCLRSKYILPGMRYRILDPGRRLLRLQRLHEARPHTPARPNLL